MQSIKLYATLKVWEIEQFFGYVHEIKYSLKNSVESWLCSLLAFTSNWTISCN